MILHDRKMSLEILFWTVLILLMGWFTTRCEAMDRCRNYIIAVRQQHFRYFGADFPYWYGLGQLKQESKCRGDITAFDSGQGIAQFMPGTEREIEKQIGELNFYNPEQAIKAQAFYMSQLHRQNFAKGHPLWLTYQAYNGGWENLRAEYRRAHEIADWQQMKTICSRKIIQLKNNLRLSLCDVNYNYSRQIYRYGKIYSTGQDLWAFW